MLVASHTRPWGAFPNDRLNAKNGLCLSSIHDAAFDSGLITLDADLKVVLSKQLKRFFPQACLEDNFVKFQGKPIEMPYMVAERDLEFLAHHREEVFQR